MLKGNHSFALLLLCFGFEWKACVAFRLFEFELRPTTTSSFTCSESIASAIEIAAEKCLLNQCTEFITEVSLSYSSCTAQNNIALSGGVSDASEGTIVADPIQADTCVNNVLESDSCKELFLVVIPSLSSMTFSSQYLPETPAPTSVPVISSPISPSAGGAPTSAVTSPPSRAPTQIPSLLPSFSVTVSSQPTAAPTILMSNRPSTSALMTPTKSPVELVGDNSSAATDAPTNDDDSKSKKNTVALGAVFALTGVTVLLLGYLLVSTLKSRKRGDKGEIDRGPLDTTDTAFEHDEDPEMANRQVMLSSKVSSFQDVRKSTAVSQESYNTSSHAVVYEGENVNITENNDSLILEDDELSSDSSTLFDVNGRNGYDDAESSVFYESQGDEDDEDGTELDGTWGPDESSVVSEGLKGEKDEESMIGSTISSLGASGVENFGENPSPQQFMEWIKKSPLIPAAAKASIVAAAVAEVAASEDRQPAQSPVTLPLNFDATVHSDTSGTGMQSW